MYTVYKCEKVGGEAEGVDTGCMGKNRICNTFPF